MGIRVKVNTFEQAGRVVLNLVTSKNNRFFLQLWKDLVATTPVDTGTARWSWKLTAGNPSPVVPPRQVYGMPPEPDVWKYTYRWMNWYLVNNQDYVAGLNDGTNPTQKAPVGWIDSAVRRNVILANSGGF